jgi:hypothetical protein
MKILVGVALFSLTLLIACSTNPRAIPASPTTRSKIAPHFFEAPAGFDNKSNAVIDDQTHQSDQANFEHVEVISDGLGPPARASGARRTKNDS